MGSCSLWQLLLVPMVRRAKRDEMFGRVGAAFASGHDVMEVNPARGAAEGAVGKAGSAASAVASVHGVPHGGGNAEGIRRGRVSISICDSNWVVAFQEVFEAELDRPFSIAESRPGTSTHFLATRTKHLAASSLRPNSFTQYGVSAGSAKCS
jgi:hypothetical protein